MTRTATHAPSRGKSTDAAGLPPGPRRIRPAPVRSGLLQRAGDGAPAWLGAAVGLILCLCPACRREGPEPTAGLVQARRAPLEITVVESGTLEAAEAVNIACEVSRPVDIVSIVEEGTAITEEDVRQGKILVQFDSSELEDRIERRESQVESARAGLTQAVEELFVQQSENESSIRAAELAIVFARNDLRRLVGDAVADRVGEEPPGDIMALLEDPALGGQAREELRVLRAGIELARIRAARAQEKLDHTRRLFERNYVSRNELETDTLDLQTQRSALESAEAKLEIFRRYDFVRDVQRAWAAYREAQANLVRARAVARAREAQAQARLKSAEAEFSHVSRHLEEHRVDLERCTIRATRPGFVIYQAPQPWENRGPIRPGVQVRPGQTIIQFPDLSRMAVTVKVHESQIGAVAEKQPARVRIDAIPGRTFLGEVARKAIVPSSTAQWQSPDLKLYDCTVLLKDQDGVLRLGLTATVEILCDRLQNVLQVPVESVRTDARGRHWVYRPDGTPVPVKLGKRNRFSAAVEEGLSEGDLIRQAPPPGKETPP